MSVAFKSPASLSLRDRTRLANILARLASPADGERAAAALLASAFVARHGLNWTDLAFLPAARDAQTGEMLLGDRRRHPDRAWAGYCRRRARQPGETLNRVA